MPGKSPPVYKFRVTHSGGQSCFDIEAAYSVVEDTGHMVLKNGAGHPVFTAEPGLGCAFERRERVAAVAGAPDCEPGQVSFAEFEAAWAKACADAWDDGQHYPAVLLPDFMWPGVASMVNPVTGETATVTRVWTFPVQNKPGDEDHWTEETIVRLTHTATGKSAEAPTKDEAIGRLARRLDEDGDVSVNAARRMHGLELFGMPGAGQPDAFTPDAPRCCGEGSGCA